MTILSHLLLGTSDHWESSPGISGFWSDFNVGNELGEERLEIWDS